MRKIVCAANRLKSGLVVCGARHFDPVMRWHLKAMGLTHADVVEQGFIDQFCVFVSREEAWKIAENAGQIMRRVGGDGVRLYSENLY